MKVHVKTPARLHLGIIDVNGGLGRMYGSLGLAIQRPNVIIEASESNTLHIEGEDQERVKEAAETFLRHFKIKKNCRIKVKRSIPAHVGLGSGTQLKLAVARSLAELFKIDIPTRELSHIMGRGSVSGIGTAAFEAGGFIIDGGRPSKDDGKDLPPPVILRHPFPDDWFLVVALPGLKKGFSGKVEDRAFEDLPPAPAELVGRMCRLLMMKMLPSLLERDIVNFGSALTDLQILTGECFSSVQGGRFAGDAVAETVNFMLAEGAYGAGQSSWGPAVYGLAEGRSEAESLYEKVQRFLDSNVGGYSFYTRGDNRGAEVKIEDN
ncbi:MAG: beta-ribofuranosylaminobenzene 5'-phosphate synthase family protein [Nitrososphaerales archaeon]